MRATLAPDIRNDQASLGGFFRMNIVMRDLRLLSFTSGDMP